MIYQTDNIDSIKKGKTKIVAIYLKWNFLKSSKIDMGWKCSTVKTVKKNDLHHNAVFCKTIMKKWLHYIFLNM